MSSVPIKVLLIEADRAMRHGMRNALETAGCAVAEATRGEIGLALAKRFGPALIVLDATLPDVAGHIVLQELKREVLTADVPVILLVDGDQLHHDLTQHLVAARLLKPIAPAQLVSAVQRAVETRHQPLDGWMTPHET